MGVVGMAGQAGMEMELELVDSLLCTNNLICFFI